MFGVSLAVVFRCAQFVRCRKGVGLVAALAATALAVLCSRPATAQSGAWDFNSYTFNLEEANASGSDIYTPSGSGAGYLPAWAFARIPSGANGTFSASIKGTTRIIATWTPPYFPSGAPIPKPPATVTVRIFSSAAAEYFNDSNQPSFAQASSPELNNGFDDPKQLVGNDPNPVWGPSWTSSGYHLKTFSTGDAQWDSARKVYTLALPLGIKMSSSVKVEGSYYNYGAVSARLSQPYVTVDPRSMSLYAISSSPYWLIKNEDDDREIGTYAKLDWYDDGVAEHPLMPFFSGAASVSLFASNGANPISLQNYKWSASPDPYTPSTPLANPYSTVSKEYSWNLGTSASALPKSATVNVSATDPSDGTQFSGKAKINFHWAFEGAGGGGDNDDDPNPPLTQLPGSTVDKLVPGPYGGTPTVVPTPIQNVQVGDYIKVPGKEIRRRVAGKKTNPDGSITLTYDTDPDDNPDDPAYDLNTQITRLQDANTDVIHKGAKYVKTGLEAYVELAKTPYYNLGGAALGALGSKAIELARIGAEASGVAARASALAGKFRAAASRVRSLASAGHTAEEIAQAERTAVALEQKATQLEAGAQELDSVANEGKKLSGNVMKAVHSACFVAGTLITMSDGSQKAIEQIKSGDIVLSRDPETKQTSAKKVVAIFSHKVTTTLMVHFDNDEHVECTPTHPFYVVSKGFVTANKLEAGSIVATSAGSNVRVLDVQKKSVPTTVYNFEVEDFHTYFVGRGALWVHNDCFTSAVADHGLLGHDAQFANIMFEGVVGFDSAIIGSRERFARYLEHVRESASVTKWLADDYGNAREATAYWDDVNGVIYIEDIGGYYKGYPGTAYRPDNGRQGFDNLREFIRPR